jgi:hypothetical protein
MSALGQTALSLRSALLRHRQCLSVRRSMSGEIDTTSTVSMASVMASTADEWSRFLVGFKRLPFTRVIWARHLPGLRSNALMVKDLYFITRLVAFDLWRDAKKGKALR